MNFTISNSDSKPISRCQERGIPAFAKSFASVTVMLGLSSLGFATDVTLSNLPSWDGSSNLCSSTPCVTYGTTLPSGVRYFGETFTAQYNFLNSFTFEMRNANTDSSFPQGGYGIPTLASVYLWNGTGIADSNPVGYFISTDIPYSNNTYQPVTFTGAPVVANVPITVGSQYLILFTCNCVPGQQLPELGYLGALAPGSDLTFAGGQSVYNYNAFTTASNLNGTWNVGSDGQVHNLPPLAFSAVFTDVAIPEPSTLSLLSLASLIAGAYLVRRHA